MAGDMVWDHFLLVGARLASASLAAIVAFFALRAYAGSHQRNMFLLTLGAGTLALGYFLEGVLVETDALTLHSANAMEAVFTLAALLLFVGSLYVREPTRGLRPPAERTPHPAPPAEENS